MRYSILWTALILAALFVTAVPPVRADDEQAAYTIKIDRPAKKGEKGTYELSTAERITTTTHWDGYSKPVTSEKIYGGQLVADVEVLEASDSGNALMQSYLIHTCTILKDQKDVELLPAGTKLVARASKEGTQYAVNGVPPDDSTRDSLRRLITLSASTDTYGWDTLHGTKERKRVGDTWPINVSAAVKASKQHGYLIKPEDMSGQAELVAVESCDGQKCLRIRATSQAKQLMGDESRTSNQYKLTEGSAESQAELVLPVDVTKGKRQSNLSSTVRYVYEGHREGRRYVMEQVTQTESVIKRLGVEAATTQP